MNEKEYEIPDGAKKEKTDYWLAVWEGWLERAAINLDWKPSTIPYAYEKNELVAILKEFRHEVLIHLKQVVFLQEKRKEERKKKRGKMSKPSDQNNARDRNAHERIDRLRNFVCDQNERLIQADQRLDALEEHMTAIEKKIACLPCLPESFAATRAKTKGEKEDAQTAV